MSCHLPLYIKCEVLVNWMFSEAVGLPIRSEEHTSELQSRPHLVCRLLLEKKKKEIIKDSHLPYGPVSFVLSCSAGVGCVALGSTIFVHGVPVNAVLCVSDFYTYLTTTHRY